MKIRFTEDTNIRRLPTAQGNKPIGIIYAGAELEVEDLPHTGTAISGNPAWFRDHNGWYYWSGKTEPVLLPPPVQPPVPPAAPPSTEREEEMHRPAIPALPVVLPLPDDDLSDVPEGETRRLAGPLTVAQPGVVQPDQPSAINDQPSTIGNQQPTWRSPDTRLLNWGISHFALTQWWQERGLTGRGIRVALLSTGASLDHPDLTGAISSTFDIGGVGDANSRPGTDLHGLGTQTAVVAAGRGRTVFGVAPEATLLVGKIGEYDSGITPENLLAGFNWAIDAGAHIIALLVDFRELTAAQRQDLEAAIARASDANILLLAPVGNSVDRRPEARYPACLEGVMCIGSHDQYGQRSAFSAKSYQLDVLAPGEALLTSDHQQQNVSSLKTTAVATAFAAGVFALLRQWEVQNDRLTSPHDFCENLRSTAAANKAITQGNDVGYGYGLLNPAALLQSLM